MGCVLEDQGRKTLLLRVDWHSLMHAAGLETLKYLIVVQIQDV